MEDPAAAAFGALCLERARIAGRGIGPIDDHALGVLNALPFQHVTSRTGVRVVVRIVGKLILTIERSTDALVLESHDVLDRAIGGVPRCLLRMELAPEAHSPQQVQHRLVLHDIRWGDEGGQDNASLTAIYDVVVVVAQAGLACGPHRRGIGIGRAHPEVAGTPIPALGGALRVKTTRLEEVPAIRDWPLACFVGSACVGRKVQQAVLGRCRWLVGRFCCVGEDVRDVGSRIGVEPRDE
jgi:hypothetical protein